MAPQARLSAHTKIDLCGMIHNKNWEQKLKFETLEIQVKTDIKAPFRKQLYLDIINLIPPFTQDYHIVGESTICG